MLANIARLTAVWEEEYREFRKRRLEGGDYIYVWADGVHFNVRLEDDACAHRGAALG